MNDDIFIIAVNDPFNRIIETAVASRKMLHNFNRLSDKIPLGAGTFNMQ